MTNDSAENALETARAADFDPEVGGNPRLFLIAATASPAATTNQNEIPIGYLDDVPIYGRPTTPGDTEHGHKWQCVEFVNRFYALKMGINGMRGHGASYINRDEYNMDTYRSNQATQPPQYGDILVTTISRAKCAFSDGTRRDCGHVGIAGEVTVDLVNGTATVEVKQQNLYDLHTYKTEFRRKEDGTWSGGEFKQGYSIEAWVRKRVQSSS